MEQANESHGVDKSVCLLLRTTGPSAGGETLTGGLACAVFELTPPVMARIRHRSEQILAARRQDGALYEMYFWDAAPIFYEYDLLAACEETEYAGHAWIRKFQDAGYARLPPEMLARLASKEFKPQRTECDQMAVSCSPCPGRPPDVSIKWVVIPKHGGIHVDTEQIPLVELERLAAALKPDAPAEDARGV